MDHEENYRDSALKKIGKNVVNLQRLESLLKSVIALANLQFDDADTLNQSVIENQKRVSQFTLGGLVSEFENNLDSTRDQGQLKTDYSFSILLEPEFIQDRVAAFRYIAKERNGLIHHRLSSFNENSNDSCKELIAFLDEQDRRLKPEFEILNDIITDLKSVGRLPA